MATMMGPSFGGDDVDDGQADSGKQSDSKMLQMC